MQVVTAFKSEAGAAGGRGGDKTIWIFIAREVALGERGLRGTADLCVDAARRSGEACLVCMGSHSHHLPTCQSDDAEIGS